MLRPHQLARLLRSAGLGDESSEDLRVYIMNMGTQIKNVHACVPFSDHTDGFLKFKTARRVMSV